MKEGEREGGRKRVGGERTDERGGEEEDVGRGKVVERLEKWKEEGVEGH